MAKKFLILAVIVLVFLSAVGAGRGYTDHFGKLRRIELTEKFLKG